MITMVDPGFSDQAIKQLPELFVDGRMRKGRNGEADSDALYDEIGRLKRVAQILNGIERHLVKRPTAAQGRRRYQNNYQEFVTGENSITRPIMIDSPGGANGATPLADRCR